MTTFRTRLSQRSKTHGKIILANDYNSDTNLKRQTIQNIKKLSPFLCGIKLNLHTLLPLSSKDVSQINHTAHEYNLQTIADIKLNDIGNTNRVAVERLWDMGFDAVIVNPIMGLKSLQNLVKLAHKQNKGVISLCHMSAPEAQLSYDMVLQEKKQRLYQLFLDWAASSRVDGIVIGATFPEIIQYAKKTQKKLKIFSPGIGTQGGDPSRTISSGSDYLIVGRSILYSKNPVSVLKSLHLQSLVKRNY